MNSWKTNPISSTQRATDLTVQISDLYVPHESEQVYVFILASVEVHIIMILATLS